MILREWRAKIEVAATAPYTQHFSDEVLPKLQAIDGFLEATLAYREIDGHVEVLVLTKWRSIDAIRSFAGDRETVATVDPAVIALFREFDLEVRHYAIVPSDQR